MHGRRILVTGSTGYVGSALVPVLLARGAEVVGYDLNLYGDTLEPHQRLTSVVGDIRDRGSLVQAAVGCDAVVHLACISNDPSFDLDPALGRSVNFEAFAHVVEAAVEGGAERLVVASSTAQYGIKPLDVDVTEEVEAAPITDYARYKIECEQLLRARAPSALSYVFARPATLCGWAPRLRLDLSVNILTIHALVNRRIKVFGGSQMRPALHIADMVRFYETVLSAEREVVHQQAFNVAAGNFTVMQLAQMVRDTLGGGDIEIDVTTTDDPRSYHVNTDKVRQVLGFECAHTLADAVLSLRAAFVDGLLDDPLHNPLYYNLKRMQQLQLR